MADLVPQRASTANGLPTSTDPSTLKSIAAPAATTYTNYPTDPDGLICLGWNSVRFGIDYKNGAEDSVEFVAEGYDGATWRRLTYKAAQASGVSVLTTDPIQVVKATYVADASYGAGATAYLSTPRFDCVGFQKVRIKEKYTGAAPNTGRTTIVAFLGMDVVAA